MIPYILTALGGYLIGSSVKQYASGGQVQLLAPNGKPSNLTPEQYKLVRTPEFKAWFGDWENDSENASKVVDENGEPLVVYHGTKADFSTFKSDFLIWVTSDFDYVKERIENEGRFNKHFELFCKSKNYLDLSSIGYKGISGKDFYEEIKNKYGVEIIELLSNENDFRRPYAFINTYSRSKFLKKYGFDGFKIAIDNKNFGIAVFNPEQVKLADGTNTTFDGSNPDIRYEEGGGITKDNYFENTNIDFEAVEPILAKKIMDEYHLYRRKKIKPDFIEVGGKKYSVDFESQKKNAFFNSRSNSFYFISEDGKELIRISDHWSKTNPKYSKRNKMNVGKIRSVYWTNMNGEIFPFRLAGEKYSSDLMAGKTTLMAEHGHLLKQLQNGIKVELEHTNDNAQGGLMPHLAKESS